MKDWPGGADDARPRWFRASSADAGIPGPDVGNTALERDCFSRHAAESRIDRLYAGKRYHSRPAQAGRSGVRLLWAVATASQRLAGSGRVGVLIGRRDHRGADDRQVEGAQY